MFIISQYQPVSFSWKAKYVIFVRLILLGLLTGCSPIAQGAETAEPTVFLPLVQTDAAIWQPTPGTSWQWQLSGTIDTSFDVMMYDIDLFDTPQATIDLLHGDGRIVICYFSAGSYENWRPDAGDFPGAVLGNTLDGWPDERWLDIRQIGPLAPIMEARLDLAVAKKCDGVEPDNVDGYSNNSGFPLTGADQLAYNTWLADAAHTRRLSIGLKNDLDQITELVTTFDWALNEQCYEFDECDLLRPFVDANKAVFGVEYEGDPATFCPYFNNLDYDWLFKNLDLDADRIACR
ncbi:MAG: endo alpha-1,4 polygalactosaminidase [Anaerolineales bacterium]|nr:endo alpha-1,4 polygalactosaminidase [Anaerolineales bacterium]